MRSNNPPAMPLLLMLPFLQTKQGTKAKATVQVEFEDVMTILHQQATTACATRGMQPLYIYDNVALQRNARYTKMGFRASDHMKTPAHSPDFNKPVEHIFNQVKNKLLQRLYAEYDTPLTPERAQKLVLEAFQSITITSIQADIESLIDTWEIVSADAGTTVHTTLNQFIPGADGDYPSSSTYR
jgi:hypothetical protein